MKEIVYKSDVVYSHHALAILEANKRKYPVGTLVEFADGICYKRVVSSKWRNGWTRWYEAERRTIYVCPHCEKEIRDLADSGDDPNACAECGKLFVQPMERKV